MFCATAYGVLTAFDETPTPGRSASLLNRIDFVTGVSGGSVLAAYYGLKKRAALADFKQRFLLRNAEESLQMNLNLLSLAKGLQGGINELGVPLLRGFARRRSAAAQRAVAGARPDFAKDKSARRRVRFGASAASR